MTRLKLDENLGRRLAVRLREAGHDVDMVLDEHLSGASDAVVIQASTTSSRALVTLDLDFASPVRFPPGSTAGVIVLRVRDRPGRRDLDLVVDRLIRALEVADPLGRLWVVEAGRVRQYEEAGDIDRS